eukprot:304967-Prymnesium_polylepis.1
MSSRLSKTSQVSPSSLVAKLGEHYADATYRLKPQGAASLPLPHTTTTTITTMTRVRTHASP